MPEKNGHNKEPDTQTLSLRELAYQKMKQSDEMRKKRLEKQERLLETRWGRLLSRIAS